VKFERPQHVIIQSALQSMDFAFLQRSHCYFGGGTAIVLMNGEYRLSLDVDFLCADIDGYRDLRSSIRESGAHAIFSTDVETVRGFKADQYGIRGVISLEGQPIKFEIVREARIPLDGTLVDGLGVPVLTIESQFSEKLLANADRCLDKSVAYRDAIDLGYLVKGCGSIPASSIEVAERAYGKDVLKALGQALARLAMPEEALHAADALQMQVADVTQAASVLRKAASTAWPDSDLPEFPEPDELPEP
jgi:hypothetical protein